MSPKVPQAYLDARRAEIMDAAVKCFMEKGFHNTTMQDIYDATRLSPGAVYNYFTSKEDIVISVLTEFRDWSISSMTPLLSENQTESLIKYVEFWIAYAKENVSPERFSITLDYYSETARKSDIREAVLKSQDASHEKIMKIVKNNQLTGEINPRLDPLSVARVMGSLVFGAAIHKMLNPQIDLDAYSQVCEALLKGTFSVRSKRRSVKNPKAGK
jgi:AcrR family transcriptional regulator